MKSDHHNNCSGCSQEDTCRQMYEKLGNAKGPSVLGKVFLAFLVPIFVFIATLAVVNEVFKDRLSETQLTLTGFVSALLVTLVAVFTIRAIRRPHSERK